MGFKWPVEQNLENIPSGLDLLTPDGYIYNV